MTHEESSETLTALMDRFAHEYVADFNGSAAYMRANPRCSNKKSAGVQACKYLKMPKVKEAVKAYTHEVLGPLEKHIMGNVQFWIDIRDGVTEEEQIPRSEVLDILEKAGISKAAIKKINDLKICRAPEHSTNTRLKASENLAKWEQMFVEKKEIDISAQVTIVDDIV